MNKLPRKYIKNYSSDKYFCNRLYIFRFSFFHLQTFAISEFLSKRCWSRKSCFSWENRRKWLKDGIGREQHFTENLLVWRIIEAICGMSTGNRFVLITYSHEGLCTLKSKVGFSRRLIEVRACTVGPDTPMPVPSTILAEKAGPSFLSRTRYVDRADFWPWIPVRCRVPVVLGVIVGRFYCARRKDILEISYMIRE